MNVPIVSIIMPCFNQSGFLNEAVQSVLDSDYKNWELIIVNDGSTDSSSQVGLELAIQYSEQITYIDQENHGIAHARNQGIAKSRGKYILPLDGEDKISEDYISKAVEILDSRPEVKVVYCDAKKFGDDTSFWKLRTFSRESLAKDNMIFVSAFYRKSDWVACGGYDNRMAWGQEEWEFWINMLKSGGEVVKLPIIGFYYRIRQDSKREPVYKSVKRKTIDLINQKHQDFLFNYLHGPLRYQRFWSYWINKFARITR